MIRIDPNVTEMPEPIPWIKALTITAAVAFGRAFLRWPPFDRVFILFRNLTFELDHIILRTDAAAPDEKCGGYGQGRE